MKVLISKRKNVVSVWSDGQLITHGTTPQHTAFARNVRKSAERQGKTPVYPFLSPDGSYECEITF